MSTSLLYSAVPRYVLCDLTGNMFGDQKTMREIIREQKRMVDRAARALERDRQNLEREEKKLIQDIKKNAKENRLVHYTLSH